jgi:hypothetical protein
VYSRQVAGETLEFGVSGKLIMNVLVMYDRQTNSLWSQLLGIAVRGELQGTELEYIPAWQTTWEDWKTKHPDTQALVKGYTGIRDPYLGYYQSNQAGVIGESIRDKRLDTKEFIIGVALNGEAVAFPFRKLNEEPLVNHTVGENPVLVVFDPENAGGIVFNRTVEGQVLTFVDAGNGQMSDEQTGSRWDRDTGEGITGEFEMAQLERVKSTLSFWFGWKDFYPDSVVYGEGEG